MVCGSLPELAFKKYYGEAAAELPPLSKHLLISATSSGDGGVLIDDLAAVNEVFILATFLRNVSLFLLSDSLKLLLSV